MTISENVVPRDVTPNFKPLVDCACGCGMSGTPRRKAWVDGFHVRRCACRRCVGSRQRGNARRRENRVANELGGSREVMSGALSGVDVRAGMWVFEETAEVRIVQGLRRWWSSKQTTTKLARIMARRGEARAFVASWDGKPQLVVIPWEDFAGQIRGGNL